MSTKTSTAALASLGQKPLHYRRRVPRHPAGETQGNRKNGNLRSTVRQTETSQARIASNEENAMNSNNRKLEPKNLRMIFPVILRITCALVLWTMGVTPIVLAQAQTKEQRDVTNFPIDRAKIENLQRWVNAGHDDWCRDPQLVAAAAIRRVSPEFSNFELASLPLEAEHSCPTRVIYTYHSIDGRTTIRITLGAIAGSSPPRAPCIIWFGCRSAAKSSPETLSTSVSLHDFHHADRTIVPLP